MKTIKSWLDVLFAFIASPAIAISHYPMKAMDDHYDDMFRALLKDIPSDMRDGLTMKWDTLKGKDFGNDSLSYGVKYSAALFWGIILVAFFFFSTL